MAALLPMLGNQLGAKKILDFLIKKSPELAPGIAKALGAGLSAERVLSFFSKEKNFEKLNPELDQAYSTQNNANPLVQAQNIRNQNLAPDMASGLQRSAPLLIGGAAGLAANMALKHALPNPLKSSIPETQGKIPETQSLPPPSTPSIPQTPNIQPPQIKPLPLEVSKKVEELVRSGNGPEEISAYFQKFNPKAIKEVEKESGVPFAKAIEEHVKATSKQPQISPSVESLGQELDEKFALPNESATDIQKRLKIGMGEAGRLIEQRDNSTSKPIEKHQTVASPQGVGEVREIRGDQALIEVDGKLHKVDVDELEQEPQEVADLDLEEPVKEYLSRIPEGQKSSVIDVSLYDDTTQELQVRFPNGDQWVYGPIPEEIFEKINSMTGIPVSSGESKLRGTIWESGVANSAGADFYKLIKKFVKDGTVKERKLKTGIDLFKGFTRVKKRK